MARVLELVVLGCIFGLRLALADFHPRFQSDFESKNVQEYGNLELNCSASGALPLNYTWYDTRERKILSDNSKITMVDEERWSSLLIENVSRSDGGIYTCTAANVHGLASKLFQVSVDEATAYFRIIQLDDVEVPIGGEALIECKVEGVPKPNVNFKKFNESGLARVDNRIKVSQQDKGDVRIVTLRIEGVKRSDEGFYVCQAWNSYNSSERTSHLQVQFPPEIKATRSPVYIWPPMVLTLNCSATAIPNATLTWYFEREKVNRKNHTIKGELSFSSLEVKATSDPSVQIYGVYECVAHNTLGLNAAEIEVKKGKTPDQIDNIILDRVTATSITLVFIGPAEEKQLPIRYYHVTYKNLNQPEEREFKTYWKKGSPYIIKFLSPGTRYQIQAAAANDVGTGPWKTVAYETLSESVPEPPRILNIEEEISMYPDRFTVAWLVPDDNGSPILYFSIEYYEVQKRFTTWSRVTGSTEILIRNWFGNPSLTLTNLTASTYYKVEITAVNKVGRSRPDSVVFKTSEDINEIITVTRIVPVLPIILSIVGLFILYVIIDVISFFTCRCGLLHLIRRGKCKG